MQQMIQMAILLGVGIKYSIKGLYDAQRMEISDVAYLAGICVVEHTIPLSTAEGLSMLSAASRARVKPAARQDGDTGQYTLTTYVLAAETETLSVRIQ